MHPEPFFYFFWRRHPDSNRRIKVLQTSALPLGYGARNYPVFLKISYVCVKINMIYWASMTSIHVALIPYILSIPRIYQLRIPVIS